MNAPFFDPGPLVRPAIRTKEDKPDRLSLARRAIGPLLVLALWAGTTSTGLVSATTLPSPSALATTLAHLWTEQALPHQVAVSLTRALAGAALGISLGLLLGIIAGLTRLGEELFDATLQMMRTAPPLALVPLFIVWFGVDETPKLLLIGLATLFPMYLNTYSGVRNVDRKVVEASRTFGLRGPRLIREVILPLALPSILTGLRFSLGVSLLMLIAAETINAQAGLGYLLNTAQVYQQVDVILVCIFIYAVLGLGADLFVRLLERVLMPWRANLAAR
ncbi:sulfonate transport system permease protein [Novosphingobium sp. PhB165]|uniref:ABC transporter permease n=1 Tax=Novosphingobium sp. PhB165 TaxID=2485105 RepID=UPI0010464A48|nr:ABC transporter permease [Novosphingobium sp. PhB165]TCM20457.1 sulfonate transport system permease protein [Novosphingobium sp. PhB165]